MTSPTLPVIDLGGGVLDPANPRVSDIAATLDVAFRRTGFCYVTGTGIDPALRSTPQGSVAATYRTIASLSRTATPPSLCRGRPLGGASRGCSTTP